MAEVIERTDAAVAVGRRGVGHLLDRVATAFSMLGALTFFALIAMSLVSIIGRKLYAAPVQEIGRASCRERV